MREGTIMGLDKELGREQVFSRVRTFGEFASGGGGEMARRRFRISRGIFWRDENWEIRA